MDTESKPSMTEQEMDDLAQRVAEILRRRLATWGQLRRRLTPLVNDPRRQHDADPRHNQPQ